MRSRDELLEAIRRHALIRTESGARIVASERTGAQSPWMFDFRALLLQPQWLDRYAELFWERYADQYPFQVCGMETAGISLVAAIVMKGVERGTPANGLYVRKSRKRYNLMKQIEGAPTDDPVIMVDDLINTGQTFNRQIEVLSRAGMKVTGAFALLSFRKKSAYVFFERHGIALDTVFSLSDFGLSPPPEDDARVPRDTFDVRWRFDGSDPSFHLVVQKSAPVFADGRLFFGADSGAFYALDAETGTPAWTLDIGRGFNGKSILSTPVVHDGTVIFGAYDGNVYALDAETGAKRWMNADADAIGSSPSIAPQLGIVFIGLEFGLLRKRGGIGALSLKDGATVWSARHPEYTHGSPLYIKEEQLVVIGSNDGALYAYEAARGELAWRYQTQGDIKVAPAYDGTRRIVLAASMDGSLYAVSAADGTPRWARKTGAGIYSIPLSTDDAVYVASLDKRIYAFDADTGKDRWTFATGGRIFGAPVLALGSLWCGSNDGRLYELDPATGKLRNFFQASERVMSKIAYDEKTVRIFFRTAANEVYCLQRKAPASGK